MGFLMDLSSKPKQSFLFCLRSLGRVYYSLWRVFMFWKFQKCMSSPWRVVASWLASESSPWRVGGELVASGYSSF
ncbi:hypothetical protein P8452_19538 [Trifolium repens]|nr:hypothetical protein P8452_19538 [Trifolium repens]